MVDGNREAVLVGAGVAAGVEEDGLPKPKEGEGAAAPPAALAVPEPTVPNKDGLAALLLVWLKLLPKGDAVELGVAAPPPPKRPPGLLAPAAFDPKRLEVPAVDAPPKSDGPLLGVLDVLFVAFAVPNSEGVEPVEALLAAPNKGLFGVLLLLCCPKLKAMLCDVGSWDWPASRRVELRLRSRKSCLYRIEVRIAEHD